MLHYIDKGNVSIHVDTRPQLEGLVEKTDNNSNVFWENSVYFNASLAVLSFIDLVVIVSPALTLEASLRGILH